MGIKDLLKFMKPYIKPIHIKKYAGKRVGIDAYSWLHKGAYSCSMEICLNSDGKKKLRYIDYFMHRINLLRHYRITPVIVFDGGNIPCKAATEHDRHKRRMANRDLAMEKLKEGNVNAASELFQRAVSITPSMAHQLIQILRSENVEFVVAPYEADAQLAYLSSLEVEKGGIEAVITEDSDLVAYGCQAVIFKMDRYGNGEEIVMDDIFDSVSLKPSFQNFDKELFTGMCVLAGCDFLPSIPGIGIAKAFALVSKYRNLERVVSVLKFEKGNLVPEDYSKSFIEAVSVFQHAQIYDTDMKKLKHMRPVPQKLLQSLDGEIDFLGPEIPPSVAIAIAEGNMDPISMEAFDCSPTPRCHTDPVRIQISGRLPRVEAASVPARDGCFVAFSSQKPRGNSNTGKL
ncbi:exonuclease 1 [Ziziphus jujuba]|uniref:Exonuclease 1 n=1 Tax=Ziziphus jujuba TaxID=326968 RepID=A0A6P6FSC8_ZIZJJ|nr:exonuclease 1 [Ziziphus jujuba]